MSADLGWKVLGEGATVFPEMLTEQETTVPMTDLAEGMRVETQHGPGTVVKVLRTRAQVRYDSPRPHARLGAIETESLPMGEITPSPVRSPQS
jgi:hypothetical protein